MLLKGLMLLIAGPAALVNRAQSQNAPGDDTSAVTDAGHRVSKRRRSTGARIPDEEAVSIIAHGVRVEGELSGSGVIRIEGAVVGTVRAEHQVNVAEGGTVEGDIHAHEAILSGEVVGSIMADGRVEVTAAAVIHGDITTPNLAVHEGSTVSGSVQMVKKPVTGEAH